MCGGADGARWSRRLPVHPSGPLQVPPGTGVDPDVIAGVDEERDVHGGPGLQGGGLGPGVGGVTLEPGIGLLHLQLDRGGQLDAEDLVVIHEQGEVDVLLEPASALADLLGREWGLVVGGRVHDHVGVPVPVEELGLTALDPGAAELLLGAERLLGHGPRREVLHLGAHDGGAPAQLDVVEVEDLEELTAPLHRGSGTEVACIDHWFNSLLSRTIRVAASRATAYPEAPSPRMTESAASAVSMT